MFPKKVSGIILAAALFVGPTHAEDVAAPANIIEVDADQPLAAMIDGHPAQVQVVTGFVDRLTLNTEYVAKRGIKPAMIMGNADVNFWGKREIKGKNRPLGYSIAGKKEKGRAFWFADVPPPRFDASLGPFAIPFDVIKVRLSAPAPDEQMHGMIYFGDLNNGSNAGHIDPTFRTTVNFAVEKRMRYPLASAATGAAIAAAYGGTLSGDTWEEEIAFGIKRPVRLLTLDRPFAVGVFRFTAIAVRVRSSMDAGGSGDAIAEATASEDSDPAEIVVMGTGKKPKQPIFTFDIDRNVLDACSSIVFDKPAKQIRLSCRP
jgi:hypothetical protein